MRIYSEWLHNLSLLSIEHNRHAETHHETNNVTEQLGPFDRTMAGASLEPFIEIPWKLAQLEAKQLLLDEQH